MKRKLKIKLIVVSIFFAIGLLTIFFGVFFYKKNALFTEKDAPAAALGTENSNTIINQLHEEGEWSETENTNTFIHTGTGMTWKVERFSDESNRARITTTKGTGNELVTTEETIDLAEINDNFEVWQKTWAEEINRINISDWNTIKAEFLDGGGSWAPDSQQTNSARTFTHTGTGQTWQFVHDHSAESFLVKSEHGDSDQEELVNRDRISDYFNTWIEEQNNLYFERFADQTKTQIVELDRPVKIKEASADPTEEEVIEEEVIDETSLPLPGAPKNLSVENVRAAVSSEIRLSWDAPDEPEEAPENTGEAPITEYKISIRAEGELAENWEIVGSALSTTISNLIPNRKYGIRILAINESGEGEWSETLFFKTLPRTPLPVQNLEAEIRGRDSIVLSWDAPIISDEDEVLGYEVHYSTPEGETVSESIIIETEITIDSLIPGNIYSFRVVTRNSAGLTESEVVQEYLPLFLGAPENFSVVNVPNSSEVSFSWEVPEETGETPIESYTIRYRAEGSEQIEEISLNAEEFSKTVSLRPKTDYLFTISSSNGDQTSSPSEEISITTLANPPSKPLNLQGESATPDSISLSWDAPENTGGAPITRYEIISIEGAEGEEVTTETLELSRVISDLKQNKDYRFKVAAINESGRGEWSEILSLKTQIQVPEAVQALRVVSREINSIEISWDSPNNWDESVPLVYEVRYSAGGEEDRYKRTSSTSTTVEGLTEETEYVFEIKAVNETAKGAPVQTSEWTKSPSPERPEDLNLVSKTSNSLTVSWTRPTPSRRASILGYKINILNEQENENEILEVEGSVLSATISDLIPNRNYEIKILAINESGESEWSDILTLKTFPRAPPQVQNLEVAIRGRDSIVLSWDAPIISDQDEVLEYEVYYSNSEEEIVVKLPATETEIAIGNLIPGNNYSFRVVTRNSAGLTESEVVQEYLPLFLGTPENFSVANVPNSSEVSFSWEAPEETGETPIESYTIQYRVEGSDQIEEISFNAEESSKTVSLRPKTDYLFTISSSNRDQTSSPSEEISITTLANPPSKPLNLQGESATPDSISFSWDAPENTGGAPITGYEIISIGDEGEEVTTETFELSRFISDLKQNKDYRFKVAAINESGRGEWSEILSIKTQIQVPEAVQDLRVVSRGINSIEISWNSPNNWDESVPLVYEIRYSAAGEEDRYKRTSSTSTTVEGLTEETEYVFEIKAVNETAEGESVQTSERTKPLPPESPEGLNLVSRTSSSLTVSWTRPTPSRRASILGYKINILDEQESEIKILEVEGSVLSATISDLTPNRNYEIKILAINESGEGEWSDTLTLIAFDEAPPVVNLNLGQKTATSISLNWEISSPDSNDYDLNSYKIYYWNSDQDKNEQQFIEPQVTDSEATITGLTPGARYSFQVTSFNSSGETRDSNLISARTTIFNEAPVVDSDSRLKTSTSIKVNWEIVTPNDYNVIFYRVYYWNSNQVRDEQQFVPAQSYHSEATITGLTPGETYSFAVAAYSDDNYWRGEPLLSPVLSGVTMNRMEWEDYINDDHSRHSDPGNLILNFRVTEQSREGIKLEWDTRNSLDNPDMEEPTQSYQIYYWESGTEQEDARSITLDSTVSEYEFNDLDEDKTYLFILNDIPKTGNTPRLQSGKIHGRTSPNSNALVFEGSEDLQSTSLSASLIARTVNEIKGRAPELTDSEILNLIFLTADDIGDPGIDSELGQGTLNRERLSETLECYLYEAATLTNRPSQPRSLQEETPTSDSISLSWEAPRSKEGTPITGYKISIDDEERMIENPEINGSTLSTTISDLIPSRNYEIKILAINEFGEGEWSETLDLRTLPQRPTKVTNLVATARGRDSFYLSWDLPEDWDRNIPLEYKIYYWIEGGTVNVLETESSSKFVKNLDVETEYRFQVSAKNESVEGDRSASVSGRTKLLNRAPSATTDSTLLTTTSVQISLYFGNTNGYDLNEYKVYWWRSDQTRNDALTMIVPGTSQSVTIKQLSPGESYSFAVSPIDSAGNEGSISPVLSGVTTDSTVDWEDYTNHNHDQQFSSEDGAFNFRVTEQSETSIKVKWRNQNPSRLINAVENYWIHYWKLGEEDQKTRVGFSSGSTEHTFTNLDSNSIYVFYIEDVRRDRREKVSNEIYGRTLPNLNAVILETEGSSHHRKVKYVYETSDDLDLMQEANSQRAWEGQEVLDLDDQYLETVGVVNLSWGSSQKEELRDSFFFDFFKKLAQMRNPPIIVISLGNDDKICTVLDYRRNTEQCNYFAAQIMMERSLAAVRRNLIIAGGRNDGGRTRPGEVLRDRTLNTNYVFSTAPGWWEAFSEGTSYSAPHIARTINEIKSRAPSLSNSEILDLLFSTADDFGVPGIDNEFGRGELNRERVFETLNCYLYRKLV